MAQVISHFLFMIRSLIYNEKIHINGVRVIDILFQRSSCFPTLLLDVINHSYFDPETL